MKKILVILCILLSLVGCGNSANKIDNQSEEQIIVFPSEQTKSTLNGYKNVEIPSVEIVYIGNSSSKKFHKAECTYAKTIKQSNIANFKNREDFISNGYTPCGSCKP